MSYKHILFLYLAIFISIPSFALSENAQKSNERENKGLMQKDLRSESKRDLKQDVSIPKEKINLPKVYKEENSSPSKETKRSEFGNQKPCTQTLMMMEKRIETLESNLQKRKALRDKIQERLSQKIQTLKLSGVDTSKVEASLSEYLNQTDEVLKQREGIIMVLADLTRFDCGGDPVNFKANLKDFNQRFKNQNLEFNRINKEFRLNVLYELNKLIERSSSDTTSSTDNE
jgi:hypothetical protein